jgi:hypothetical protein
MVQCTEKRVIEFDLHGNRKHVSVGVIRKLFEAEGLLTHAFGFDYLRFKWNAQFF